MDGHSIITVVAFKEMDKTWYLQMSCVFIWCEVFEDHMMPHSVALLINCFYGILKTDLLIDVHILFALWDPKR